MIFNSVQFIFTLQSCRLTCIPFAERRPLQNPTISKSKGPLRRKKATALEAMIDWV